MTKENKNQLNIIQPSMGPWITRWFQCCCSVLSFVLLFATPWTAAHQASLAFTISQSLLRFMFTESVMPSNHLILCCPLLFLPSIFPSTRAFSSELALCTRWPKYWSISFSISPCNEDSGLISFRIDWFDLPAVQGTLKGKQWKQRQTLFFWAPKSLQMVTAAMKLKVSVWEAA